MQTSSDRPFGWKWVAISLAVFLVTDIVLGVVAGKLLSSAVHGQGFEWMVEGLMHLGAFFLGGVIVGVISPGVRIIEPGVAGFLAVALMLVTSLFSPVVFLRFSNSKLLLGGAIAFGLAMAGARIGERLTGHEV